MKFIVFALTLSVIGFAAMAGVAVNPAELHVSTLEEVQKQFADPPAAYRPAPLWVWNDDLQEDEIALQLDELKAGGFGGVFVHPRPGLITPYLSPRWLELWKFTAQEAEKRGMVTYIYDENSYPSGFAGGFVPEEIPDAVQLSLHRQEIKADQLDQLVVDSKTLALYRITGADGAYERVAIPALTGDQKKNATDLGLQPAAYIVYRLREDQPSPWYGGKTFVDLMRPDVTKKFLDITLGAYDQVLSSLYGKTVLASFADEPQVAGGWSTLLPETFKTQWGYDILDCLPSIHAEVGDWRRIRHDYASTILDLFMNNFAKPYYEACEKRGIAFTGHVWEHGWPHLNHNPDIMSFYYWERWPGIDCLMNNYSESTDAQFGNYRSNKELDSIANQMGRVRKLCETYGAGGWDLRLEDVKRIGDHLYAGGVNLMNPHLSYYTIRGARKRDHPQSFSYHEPYWEAFHIPMDYFGRLSWALASGKEQNPILVIEPTVTMWMYNGSATSGETLQKLGSEFQSYITELGAAQVAFDLGSEPVMTRIARVDGKKLVVGECAYDVVVLPPGMEGLEKTTVDLLTKFAENGGTMISLVGVPKYVDGRLDDSANAIQEKAGDRWIEKNVSSDELAKQWGNGGVFINMAPPQTGRVYHYVREMQDGKLIFLVNTSLDQDSTGTVESVGADVACWDAVSGKTRAVEYQVASEKNSVQWEVELPPAGSALFAVYSKPAERKTDLPVVPSHPPKLFWTPGSMEIQMLSPNVIPLDYVDLVLNGETTQGLYFYDAQTRIFQSFGFPRDPWDNGVQFKDELIQKDHFPADSGFEMRYPFVIDEFPIMPPLKLAVEWGNRYTVTVNGHQILPEKDQWWLDRDIRIFEIKPEWLQKGRNEISTVAKPFSLFLEPEPVYLLGDFQLKSAEHGWTLAPAQPLQLGTWSKQGRPCYADKVAYTQSFSDFSAQDKNPHYVKLGAWYGTVARVDVNGKTAGYMAWQPWELEISQYLRPGNNQITVVVYGSLKNLLGPHHAGQLRGSAWPGSFQQHPKDGQPTGDQYDVIGYGLRDPFLVY